MATIKVAGVDRSTLFEPDQLAAIELRYTATDGEVGQGSVPLPNPTGLVEPYGGQSFQFLVGSTVLFDGFVGPLSRERGNGGTGPRVVDTYSIGDENAVLAGFRAYKWKRPAETTKARFLAFLSDFVPWVTDTTWVTDDVVESMTKKTYTTETLFSELFQDISDLTGNTAFVENHRAHLHPATVGITGGLAFSDSAWDFSSTFPIYAPKRSKDAIDLRDDVMVATPKGSYTATDSGAISLYDSGGLKHQALIVLDSGTVAEATTKATATLASEKAERITYEFDTGPLTAAQLASIPVGCLIPVTSAVLGLSASTQRIAAMTVTYRHPDLFMAHIECSFPIRIRVKPSRIATIATTESSGIFLDRGNITDTEAQSVGAFQAQFSGTGDAPPVSTAYSGQPKSGLVDYVSADLHGTGAAPVGIKCLGRGSGELFFETTTEFAFDFGSPGGTTIHLEARVGSTIKASSPVQTDPGTGLHSWNPTLTLDVLDVPVANGDEIDFWVVIGVTPPHIGTVPSAGTFAPPYQAWFNGDLTDDVGIPDGVYDDLATTSTDPTLVGSPDGSGGVSWVPVSGDVTGPISTSTVTGLRNIPMVGALGPGQVWVLDPVSGNLIPGYVEDLGTAETDTTKVLAPDGAGGLVFRAESGGGGSGEMVPYYIAPGDTFTVPLYKQALFSDPIEVDGALVVNGVLIGVD